MCNKIVLQILKYIYSNFALNKKTSFHKKEELIGKKFKAEDVAFI